MKPLSPSQKSVLRVHGLIAALVIFLPAAILDTAFLSDPRVPYGVITGAALVVALLLALVSPNRRYRAWAYAVDEDELHIQSGIWLKSRTTLPFGRVQHLDLSQGPIERRFGVATLTMHTAGTRNSAVSLPGLDHEEAERMRDDIRGKIRQDLV